MFRCSLINPIISWRKVKSSLPPVNENLLLAYGATGLLIDIRPNPCAGKPRCMSHRRGAIVNMRAAPYNAKPGVNRCTIRAKGVMLIEAYHRRMPAKVARRMYLTKLSHTSIITYPRPESSEVLGFRLFLSSGSRAARRTGRPGPRQS